MRPIQTSRMTKPTTPVSPTMTTAPEQADNGQEDAGKVRAAEPGGEQPDGADKITI